jgi:ribosomal protein S18 acetylase RimI-like enzyme
MKDSELVAQLLMSAEWRHQHMEWSSPLDLLSLEPFLMLLCDEEPAALLACPMDPPQVAWLRVFAVSPGRVSRRAWEVLWPEAAARVFRTGADTAAAIPIETWLVPLLVHAGFQLTNSVVFFEWQGEEPACSSGPGVRIRPMRGDELPRIAELDSRAFSRIWRHSLSALCAALPKCQLATVLEIDGDLAGYQMSTVSAFGGHLARLAVDPEQQGRGLAKTLVADVLRHLGRRGIERMTVNTQADNVASQCVYRSLGFRESGPQYPVYEIHLGNL